MCIPSPGKCVCVLKQGIQGNQAIMGRGITCLLVTGHCIYIQLIINYWCSWPPFNDCLRSQTRGVCFPLHVGMCLSSGGFLHLMHSPKHSNPLLSVYFESPEQGLSLFYENQITRKHIARGARSGCKHRHTISRSKAFPILMPSACLCRPTGNSRMLTLDVKKQDECKIKQTAPFKRKVLQAFKGTAFLVGKEGHAQMLASCWRT